MVKTWRRFDLLLGVFAFHTEHVCEAVRLESASDDLKVTDFLCPEECQECCRHSRTTFKCVLKMEFGNATSPTNRSCDQVQRRHEKGQEAQAKVHCKYLPGEKPSQSSELATECSSKSRCCCNGLGMGMCIGNSPHKDRLHRLYSLGRRTLREAFPFTDGNLPKLNSWGTCPIGFSDWRDGIDTPCSCDTACGDSAKMSWPPEPRAPEDSHRWKQMVGLAAAVYAGEPRVSGWKLEKFWDVAENWNIATDFVAIYRREIGTEKQCALSFAGTDDLMNLGADLLGWARWAHTWCGFDTVHASFANYMRAFMNGRRFKEFDSFLSNSSECERVIAVGHSLGGSMADLMAACANRPDSEVAISKKVSQINFKVHELYTFGACGVTGEFITNHMESSQPHHCFSGARFYLEKYSRRGVHYIDPIPNIGSFRPSTHLRHPKMDVVAVTEYIGGKNKERDVKYNVRFHCNTSVADTPKEMPDMQWLQVQAPWGWLAGIHNYNLHNTKHYYDSMAHISDLA